MITTPRAFGQLNLAERAYSRVVEVQQDCRDYTAMRELAGMLWQRGAQDEAIDLLREACRKTQRIGPRVSLARMLGDSNPTEAKQLLDSGLRPHRQSPRFAQRRYRRDAREARAMLRSL